MSCPYLIQNCKKIDFETCTDVLYIISSRHIQSTSIDIIKPKHKIILWTTRFFCKSCGKDTTLPRTPEPTPAWRLPVHKGMQSGDFGVNLYNSFGICRVGHNLKRIIQLTSGRTSPSFFFKSKYLEGFSSESGHHHLKWMGPEKLMNFLSCKHVEISDFWGKPPFTQPHPMLESVLGMMSWTWQLKKEHYGNID